MERENNEYNNQDKENKYATFFNKQGDPVDSSNVYFRQDGIPYLLAHDENGQPIMTKEQLIEIKETPQDQTPNPPYSY
jgi:hypothetical protein